MTKRSIYPEWLFDNSPIPDPLGHGKRAVEFIRRLRHPASSAPRRMFQLARWQERIILAIYGPRDADGERIIREVFLMLPRGNRKTSLAAALAILHLIGPEKLPAGQIIFAASNREMAGIGFREAAEIIRQDNRLEAVTKIYDANNAPKTVKSLRDGSTLKAVSSDGKAQHGTTPTFVLADEIHTWRGRDLWEALQSGMRKRNGGLLVSATTAGRGNEGLAAERYSYAVKVASGEIQNETFLPIILQIETDEDWQDEAIWRRYNPGMADGWHDLKKMRADAAEARDNPSKAYEFQQYSLNRWFGNSRDPLFDLDTYDTRQLEDDETDLEAAPCYVGVDLALNGDLAAVVAAFKHDDGQVTIRPEFFVPGDDLKARADRDGVPYQAWADADLIQVTPGPIIDQSLVEDHIRDLCARYQVEEIAFDPHLARVMMQHLHDDGLPVIEFRQAPLTMGVAAGDLERVVNGHLIRHDGHAVLRHHFASVVASRNESTGLTRMHKAKRTDRIDGAIAAAMAVSRATTGASNQSRYNDPDIGGLTFLPLL